MDETSLFLKKLSSKASLTQGDEVLKVGQRAEISFVESHKQHFSQIFSV